MNDSHPAILSECRCETVIHPIDCLNARCIFLSRYENHLGRGQMHCCVGVFTNVIDIQDFRRIHRGTGEGKQKTGKGFGGVPLRREPVVGLCNEHYEHTMLWEL